MTVFLTLVLMAAGVATTTVEAAPPAVDLKACVPANALLVAAAEDAPQLVKSWSTTPLARMWSDPQMQRFFKPLRDELKIDRWDEQAQEETGYTVDELLAFLSGEVVLYMPPLRLEEDDEKLATDEPDVVVLAAVGDHTEELEELLLHLDEESEKEREEDTEDLEITRITRDFRDVTMHIDLIGDEDEGEEQDSWTVFGSTFVMAPTPQLLEEAIGNILDGGADEELTDSDSFHSVADHVADTDVFVYLNLDQILPFFRERIAKEAPSVADGAEVSASAADPFPPELFFDALALDVFQAAFLTLELDAGTIALDAGLSFTDNRGLVAALAYIPGAVPQPEVIPENAFNFSAGAFDFVRAWAAVEKIANTINPAALAMVGSHIQTIATNAGVELDLRRDLLDNLGTEVFSAEVPIAQAAADDESPVFLQSQVVAIEIRQRQGVELVIETLKGVAGQGSELFETRDFLGTQIHTARMNGNAGDDSSSSAGSFSYALTDHLVLIGIGSPAALEAVLIRLQKPAPSVWEKSVVRQALASLPAGASVIQYQDLAATGFKAFEMMAFLAGTTANEDFLFCDPTAVPSRETVASILGSAISGLYRDGSNLILRMRLLPTVGHGE